MRIEKQIITEKLKALADSRAPEDRKHWTVLYWKSQDKTHEQIADILDRSVQWVQRYSSRTYVIFEIKDWEDEEKIAWLEKECLPVIKELIKGDPYLFKVPLKLPPEPSKGPVIIGKVIPDNPQDPEDNRDEPEKDPPVIKIPSPRRQLPPPRRSLVETLSRYLIFGILVFLAFAVVGYYAFNFGKGFITPATPAIITVVITQTPPAITSTLTPTDTQVVLPTATDTQIPPTPKPYYDQGEAVYLKDGVYAYLNKSFIPINGSCGGSRSNFGVTIWVVNNSPDQFLLRFNSGDFHAVDDLGTDYPLSRSGMTNFTEPPGIDISVQMGRNDKLPICVVFDGNVSLKATYVLITADWLSGTEHLVFRKDL